MVVAQNRFLKLLWGWYNNPRWLVLLNCPVNADESPCSRELLLYVRCSSWCLIPFSFRRCLRKLLPRLIWIIFQKKCPTAWEQMQSMRLGLFWRGERQVSSWISFSVATWLDTCLLPAPCSAHWWSQTAMLDLKPSHESWKPHVAIVVVSLLGTLTCTLIGHIMKFTSSDCNPSDVILHFQPSMEFIIALSDHRTPVDRVSFGWQWHTGIWGPLERLYSFFRFCF